MTNVDEQAVTGSIYTRCYGINISNPHAVFKSDEEFTLLDGGKIGILPPVEQPEIL